MSIGEERNNSVVEQAWQKVLNLILIQVILTFILSEGVVEVKVVVIDKFCDAIHLKFGLMHHNFRVIASYYVDFARLSFFFEKRTLPDTDTNLHLLTGNVI